MLGGLFNTLVAPVVFSTIVEYPLVIVLACLIRQRDDSFVSQSVSDVIQPAFIGLVTVALALLVARYEVSEVAGIALVFGIPLVIINHCFRNRPVRFALAVGAVLLGSIVLRRNSKPHLAR